MQFVTIGVNLGFSGSRRLGRAERKRKMSVCQIRLKSDLSSYPLKNPAKPNFIPSESGHLTTKALGFTRFLVNMAYMEKVSFFYDFYNFGGIRSTQPTMLRGSFS